ncbi:MAG: transcription antitermination factor NusB [Arcanobacterium sp.]|nr:transcription antitermination factor NusB [Arcanobacterium sp.]
MSEKRTFKNPKRKGRSLQRQRALDVLFEGDAKDLSAEGLSQLLRERRLISTAQHPIDDFGVELVEAFIENQDDIDSMIDAASPSWSLQRMGTVDRNLLRIGATEIMHIGTDLPVVVNEIASLAREFSTDKSVGFVMGVLNRIGEIRAAETAGLADEES